MLRKRRMALLTFFEALLPASMIINFIIYLITGKTAPFYFPALPAIVMYEIFTKSSFPVSVVMFFCVVCSLVPLFLLSQPITDKIAKNSTVKKCILVIQLVYLFLDLVLAFLGIIPRQTEVLYSAAWHLVLELFFVSLFATNSILNYLVRGRPQ